MRLSSIITVVFVCIALFFVILKRDTLMHYANPNSNEVAAEDSITTATTQAIESPQQKTKAISVVVEKLFAQDVTSGIVLNGVTGAFKSVQLKALTTGRVISQPRRRGTVIEKGDILCELESGTKHADYTEAKAQLLEAQTNDAAVAELAQKGFASETQAISSKAKLEAAQAKVQHAEQNISYLRLIAPFSGFLETDAAEYGALLQPGTPCATIIALNPIKLVGFATENQVAKIQLGAYAYAYLITGEKINGQVSFISRSADQATRTFRIEVTAPNPQLKYRDGSTADIYIGLAGVKGHLLPQSALTLNSDGRLGVRTAVNGTATFASIEIIRDTAEGVWVTGLPNEVDVIILGQEYVKTGSLIDITYKGVSP